jgi:cytochrome c oxidase cbb3-type subunit II
MNQGPTIFLGALLTFAAAWLGLCFAPWAQLGHLPPAESKKGDVYPNPLVGPAAEGREVYIANGCLYCHSQQVRPAGFGSDKERGWGRRTVARDYLYDRPHLLGTMRTGPDLTNIGKRRPGGGGREYHHLHLYNPRFTQPGSIMPPFAFLYETRKVVGQPSRDALKLPKGHEPPPGFEVVPTREAVALVAYLQSLDRSYKLPEAEGP